MPNDGASGKRGDRRRKHLARSRQPPPPPPPSLSPLLILLLLFLLPHHRPRHPRSRPCTPSGLLAATYIPTLHLSGPPSPTTPWCNSFRINPRFSNAPRCFPARIYPPPYLPTSLHPRGMPRHRGRSSSRSPSWSVYLSLSLPLFVSLYLYLPFTLYLPFSLSLRYQRDRLSFPRSPFGRSLSLSLSVSSR